MLTSPVGMNAPECILPRGNLSALQDEMAALEVNSALICSLGVFAKGLLHLWYEREYC